MHPDGPVTEGTFVKPYVSRAACPAIALGTPLSRLLPPSRYMTLVVTLARAAAPATSRVRAVPWMR
jgi:hypothetical protein